MWRQNFADALDRYSNCGGQQSSGNDECRGGLNLSKAEPAEAFVQRYRGPGQPEAFWAN